MTSHNLPKLSIQMAAPGPSPQSPWKSLEQIDAHVTTPLPTGPSIIHMMRNKKIKNT